MSVEKLSGRAYARHAHGELRRARRLYLRILHREPGNFPARHMLGLVRYQEGALPEALTHFDAALEINPGVAEAWSNYGLVLSALERFDDAVEAFTRAIEIRPDYPEAFNNRAIALTRLGRLDDAVDDCNWALGLRPDYPEALNNCANALRDLGRRGDALACYNQALELAPGLGDVRANRNLLAAELAEPHLAKAERARREGRHDVALNAYNAALTIAPEHVQALNSIGCYLRILQRYDEALAVFERALALDPRHVGVLVNRGVALWDLKRYGEAIADYDRALAVEPDHHEAHNNRGIALWSLKQYEQALAAFGAALAAKPDFAHALHNRGLTLAEVKRLEEALEAYEAAYQADPTHKYNFEARAHAALHLCDWKRTAWSSERMQQEVMEKGTVVHPFILSGYSGDKQVLLRGAQNFIRDRMGFLPPPLWTGQRYGHGKIRVAYLSADYHKHATSYLVAGLMEQHDRSRFEITGVSWGVDDQSAMRARMVRSFDRFIDVRNVSDRDVARMLREMEVDIAVDLKGFTTDQRPEIFSHRPAPVAVNYLGYPGSMGADFMDYIIGDRIVTPFADAPFYSEKIVQLPDSYQVNDSRREIGPTPSRAEAGLPQDAFVFCCLNDSYKITAPVYDIWMRLLREVPGSVLWLIQCNPGTMAKLKAEAVARGVAETRIIFAPRRELADHIARQSLADLFLDTLPYNAHTTTSDALWAGLPVITCKGDSFAGRVAASLLTAAGLPELITGSAEEYERLALKLARESQLLTGFRARLAANRDSCALFDTGRFTRNIEAAYTTMWTRAEAGLAPEAFAV